MGNRGVMPRVFVLLMLLGLITAVAGCGSSGGSGSATGGETTATTSEGSGEEATGADPTKEYVSGIPTLEQLRTEGTETAPPATGPPAKKNVSVVWVSCGLESPGCRIPPEEAQSAAKLMGWNLKILDGKFNETVMQADIRSAIALKPDAIVLNGINCPEVISSLQQAKAAGIPVLGESLDCDAPVYQKEGNAGPPLFTIPIEFGEEARGIEEYLGQSGEVMAQYLINAMEGEGEVVTVPYNAGFGKTINEAWETELAKCSKCDVVESVPWTFTDQATVLAEKIETALVKVPTASGVLFPFSSTATSSGGAKAVADTGRASEIVSLAGEGSEEALNLIREEKGLTALPAAADLKWVGWAILDSVNRYLQGEPPAVEGLGYHAVDASNMPASGGVTSSVPFEEAYKKVWLGQ